MVNSSYETGDVAQNDIGLCFTLYFSKGSLLIVSQLLKMIRKGWIDKNVKFKQIYFPY